MYSNDLIKQALSIQLENNNSIKTALNYTGCSQGVINIVYYWFSKFDNDDIQQIKRITGFPTNERSFPNWWTNNFINNTLYRSRIRRYFERILQDKCQDDDDNSTLFYLGSNNICKESVREPYINTEVWRKINSNLNKIIRALFVLNFGYKMEGDDTSTDAYIRLLGVNVSERPSSERGRETSAPSGSRPSSGSDVRPSTSRRDNKFEDLESGSRSFNVGSSSASYLDWKEIPPKLDERFKCEDKEEIQHSYTYIKEQFEKFIVDTYFKREDVYRRYDYALNILMSRLKNGSFNFDDFWKLIGSKYRNNDEVKDILLTEIKIKCPTTASGRNLFTKISKNNSGIILSNNNSLDYDVLKSSSKYNVNLPSRLITSSMSFSSPEDAACLLEFNAGQTIKTHDVALKLSEVNRNYRDRIDNPICRRQYDILFNAGNYLMNHISSSGRPFILTRNCPALPAIDDSMCVPASGPSPTSTPDSTPMPDETPSDPTTPATPDSDTAPIVPSRPVPSGEAGECTAKFYDLGFIDYCAIIIEPKELKEITEKLINTIQNLQYVELSKRARIADIVPSILDKADSAADIGLQLATILYGKR